MFDENIIVEIHLKSKTTFISSILENYSEKYLENHFEKYVDLKNDVEFNLVKFIKNPFPGFALYLREYIGSKESETPEILEKCVGIIIASEVEFIKLMDISLLREEDKTLLFME